ncbi:MAG: Bug family tripartite tricarboxylate transporter substrate binding protein [Lautropia sp.]
MRQRIRFLAAGALLIASSLAAAQTYPEKPIRLIVGFPAGGGVDIVARVISRPLSAALGQTVVVDNRPGASGNIALEALAAAAPDGYTLMLANTPQLAINPALYPKLKVDVRRDVTPITRVSSIPFFAIVNTSVPVDTLQQLVAYSKQHPDKLSYASAGSGSVGHLGAELFKARSGAKLTHVPYKGGGPALQDLVAGHVQFAIEAALLVRPHVEAGKLKILAVADSRRDPQLPDIPTAKEAGVPGFEVAGWQALVAPAGLDRAIGDRLAAEIGRILAAPEIQAELAKQGVAAWPSSRAEFAKFLTDESERWTRLVQDTGARVD